MTYACFGSLWSDMEYNYCRKRYSSLSLRRWYRWFRNHHSRPPYQRVTIIFGTQPKWHQEPSERGKLVSTRWRQSSYWLMVSPELKPSFSFLWCCLTAEVFKRTLWIIESSHTGIKSCTRERFIRESDPEQIREYSKAGSSFGRQKSHNRNSLSLWKYFFGNATFLLVHYSTVFTELWYILLPVVTWITRINLRCFNKVFVVLISINYSLIITIIGVYSFTNNLPVNTIKNFIYIGDSCLRYHQKFIRWIM